MAIFMQAATPLIRYYAWFHYGLYQLYFILSGSLRLINFFYLKFIVINMVNHFMNSMNQNHITDIHYFHNSFIKQQVREEIMMKKDGCVRRVM